MSGSIRKGQQYREKSSNESLRSWLALYNLLDYLPGLVAEGVTSPADLLLLAQDDMTELFKAVPMGVMHKRKFLNGIERLRAQPEPAESKTGDASAESKTVDVSAAPVRVKKITKSVPCCGNISAKKRGAPRAPSGSAADTPRNARRRQRAEERKLEAQWETAWRNAVAAQDDSKAEEYMQKLLPTVRGRSLFPSQTKTLAERKAFKQLADNIKNLNTSCGSRSKHRGSMATRITKGLPPQFCRDALAFDPAYLRQMKKRELAGGTAPSLLTDSRTELGRANWSTEFLVEVSNFFMSRTHIISGANTSTRRLLMRKERFEVEFY